ncbi:MAG: histidinol dehydrogenase [Bacteroidia bacterium]
MLRIIKYSKKSKLDAVLARPSTGNSSLEVVVRKIISGVEKGGDNALMQFSKKFDGFSGVLTVSEKEFADAKKFVPVELKKAIRTARKNIEKFHASQKQKTVVVETIPGVKCWRRAVGIESVGLYIPGGSAPLLSTVLMLGVPARLAGCRDVILCTPAGKDGKVAAAVLFAAECCGVKKIFKVGGAQAIAAMAFGTETIPRVAKIFGPGNQYVTSAKQLVSTRGVAIDMPAGPSELAILADRTSIPKFVAADLLSQAEHGPDSQVVLVSDDEEIIRSVNAQLAEQVRLLPRRSIAERALKNSRAVLVGSINSGIEILNAYAPEHLIIACRNAEAISRKVINAGSVFLGNYSCESAGDYASGTNHTLPTNGYARAYSGVSLDSFVKQITFQKLNKKGLTRLGKTIQLMAEAEGLEAHKNAVAIRLKNEKNKNNV